MDTPTTTLAILQGIKEHLQTHNINSNIHHNQLHLHTHPTITIWISHNHQLCIDIDPDSHLGYTQTIPLAHPQLLEKLTTTLNQHLRKRTNPQAYQHWQQ